MGRASMAVCGMGGSGAAFAGAATNTAGAAMHAGPGGLACGARKPKAEPLPQLLLLLEPPAEGGCRCWLGTPVCGSGGCSLQLCLALPDADADADAGCAVPQSSCMHPPPLQACRGAASAQSIGTQVAASPSCKGPAGSEVRWSGALAVPAAAPGSTTATATSMGAPMPAATGCRAAGTASGPCCCAAAASEPWVWSGGPTP